MSWEKPLNPICIYALTCPDTGEIKYIGQTTTGITRFYGHWRDFKLNKFGRLIRVKAWIKKIKSEGKKFGVKFLDYADSREELNQKEIYWIKYYRDLGIQLLNHSDGGHTSTVRYYSDEQKAEISKRTKLAMSRPEVKENWKKGMLNSVRPSKYTPRNEAAKKRHSDSEYSNSLKTKIIDEDGNIYESMSECAKKLKVSKSRISQALKTSGIVLGKKIKILEPPIRKINK